ncbi:MAG: hypothetical protein PSV35_03335 [bacterium]|nr:hypothetical protein [bacterium]
MIPIKNYCLKALIIINLSVTSQSLTAADTITKNIKSAEKNITNLELKMLEVHDKQNVEFKNEFLKSHPIIVALENSSGGKFILYRPNKDPILAPSVPITYQLLKSVYHTSLTIYEMTLLALNNPNTSTLKINLLTYRVSCQIALDSLNTLIIDKTKDANMRNILETNLKYLNKCLQKNNIRKTDIDEYLYQVKPYLDENLKLRSKIQIDHWMKVLTEWKKMIGKDWKNTYGICDTLYMFQQDNNLFNIISRFFSKVSSNTKAFEFNTADSNITANQLINLLINVLDEETIKTLLKT